MTIIIIIIIINISFIAGVIVACHCGKFEATHRVLPLYLSLSFLANISSSALDGKPSTLSITKGPCLSEGGIRIRETDRCTDLPTPIDIAV